MTGIDTERVLLPMEVLKGRALDDDLASFLAPVEVLLVGYHVVPEQTPPGQMRDQFEARAQSVLDGMVEEIVEHGGTAETRLVFTHDPHQSIQRITGEGAVTARVHPNPLSRVENVLAVLDGAIEPDRLASFLARILNGRPMQITVLLVPTADDDDTRIDDLRRRFRQVNIPSDAVSVTVTEKRSIHEAIIDAAVDHDVTVMGPHAADWRSILFGDFEERVATESLGPVIEILPQQ